MSFLDIPKTRHLASTIGIRNMPEEAHPEFGPWLLGYEALRDVEAHWPNEVRVGKWRVGRRRDKGKFSANL